MIAYKVFVLILALLLHFQHKYMKLFGGALSNSTTYYDQLLYTAAELWMDWLHPNFDFFMPT